MRTLRSLLKDPRMRSSRSAALRGGAVRRTLATRTSHSLSQGLGFRQQRPALSGTCLRHVKQPDKHGLLANEACPCFSVRIAPVPSEASWPFSSSFWGYLHHGAGVL